MPFLAMPNREAEVTPRIGHDHRAYRMAGDADTLWAENPAQHLHTTFNGDGVRISEGEQGWDLRLLAYGRGKRLQLLAAPSRVTCEDWIEYGHGKLVARYVNCPLGVELWFDLSAPPDERQAGAPLTLVLELNGDLQARLDAEARRMTLSSAEGTAVLRYAGLVAQDAEERRLPAWLEMHDRTVLVRVEAANACYPIRIASLVYNAKLTPSS